MQVLCFVLLQLHAFLTLSQKYSNALYQSNTMNQDTIHYLFPNLNKLLNFQRKFLIRLEGTAELPWQDQRWGLHFIENVRWLFHLHFSFSNMAFPLCLPLFYFHSYTHFTGQSRIWNKRKKSLLSTSRIVPITPPRRNSCWLTNKISWSVVSFFSVGDFQFPSSS